MLNTSNLNTYCVMINIVSSVRIISYGMVKDIQRYLNEFKDKTLHNNATFNYFEYTVHMYTFLDGIESNDNLLTVHNEMHYHFERIDTGKGICRPLNIEEIRNLAYELGLEMEKKKK